MTLEEVLAAAAWNGRSRELELEARWQPLDTTVRIKMNLATFDDPRQLPARAVDALSRFLAIHASERVFIDEQIWRHCLLSHQPAKRAPVDSAQWLADATRLMASENGIVSREDALTRFRVSEVYLDSDPRLEPGVFIRFKFDWDPEHGLGITYRDGIHVDVDFN